jgi:hypothetical protein
MSKLLDIKDGITITGQYTRNIHGKKLYIYVGICNDTLTKWVTQSKWNFKMYIQMNSDATDLDYIDDKKQEMLVFETDEEGWALY